MEFVLCAHSLLPWSSPVPIINCKYIDVCSLVLPKWHPYHFFPSVLVVMNLFFICLFYFALILCTTSCFHPKYYYYMRSLHVWFSFVRNTIHEAYMLQSGPGFSSDFHFQMAMLYKLFSFISLNISWFCLIKSLYILNKISKS